MASAELLRDVMRLVMDVHEDLEIGVHLHARPEDAVAKIRATYEAGCRRFDCAIGGLGSAPFAQDALGDKSAHGGVAGYAAGTGGGVAGD